VNAFFGVACGSGLALIAGLSAPKINPSRAKNSVGKGRRAERVDAASAEADWKGKGSTRKGRLLHFIAREAALRQRFKGYWRVITVKGPMRARGKGLRVAWHERNRFAHKIAPIVLIVDLKMAVLE
jgi:hypothetical protein